MLQSYDFDGVLGKCNSSADCNSTICNPYGFCVNDYGWKVNYASGLDEGAISGIIVAWIVVLLGLYLGGLWLIFYLFKKRGYDSSQSESESNQQPQRQSDQMVPVSNEDSAGVAAIGSGPPAVPSLNNNERAEAGTFDQIDGSRLKTRFRKIIPDDI